MGFSAGNTSFFISLIFVGFAIFNFLEGEDEIGRLFLMLATLTFFFLYYAFKSVYYLKYRATFNEVGFVVFLPHIPLFFGFFSRIFSVSPPNIFVADISGAIQLSLFYNFVDIFSIPFYLFSLFLLQRTFLRYPFIRLKGHSTDGFSATTTGFLLTLEVPLIYLIIVMAWVPNVTMVLFALFYLITGMLSLFV